MRRGAYPEGKAVTTNREGRHTVPRRTSRGCQCHPAGHAKFGRLISVTRRVAIPISRLCHGEGGAHLSYLSPSGLNPCFFRWLPTHTSLAARGSDHPQTLSPHLVFSRPACRLLRAGRSVPCHACLVCRRPRAPIRCREPRLALDSLLAHLLLPRTPVRAVRIQRSCLISRAISGCPHHPSLRRPRSSVYAKPSGADGRT